VTHRVEGLTEAETRALDITTDLVAVVCQEVIGRGPTRDNDVREFVDKVHQIQAVIMSQAAGRAHPDRYRLLGETLRASDRPPNPRNKTVAFGPP
jgi:hypothetical protein